MTAVIGQFLRRDLAVAVGVDLAEQGFAGGLKVRQRHLAFRTGIERQRLTGPRRLAAHAKTSLHARQRELDRLGGADLAVVVGIERHDRSDVVLDHLLPSVDRRNRHSSGIDCREAKLRSKLVPHGPADFVLCHGPVTVEFR